MECLFQKFVNLLERLNNGELDFVVVEGLFDKSEYDATLFSLEKFIPVCSPQSEFANKEVGFQEITRSRLILRERGSGTREIFENILQKNNYSLHAFEKMIEVGNMAAIKRMVSNGLGITFLFEVACKQEIEAGKLSVIDIPGFSEQREFNFVLLKNSFFRERYMVNLRIRNGHMDFHFRILCKQTGEDLRHHVFPDGQGCAEGKLHGVCLIRLDVFFKMLEV